MRHSLENHRSQQRHHPLNLAVAAVADQPSEQGATPSIRGGSLRRRRGALGIHAHRAYRPRFTLWRNEILRFQRGTRRRAPGERLFNGSGKAGALFGLMRFFPFSKVWHHLLGKKLESLADMFVAVVAGLRGKEYQVHSGALIT